MCYYATTDYLCGDWKWGNMMLRCPRQHRIGETCGAKLVHHESVTKSATICKVCEEINTKQRRLSKTHENISRWNREPDKFSASLEKAQRESRELDEKIKELHLRRPSISTNIAAKSTGGRSSSSTAATATALPPVTSMSAPAISGYEYTSSAGQSRRQENGTYSVPRNGITPGANSVGGAGFSPGQMTSQYTSVPTGHYVNRNTSAIHAASAARPSDRQLAAYGVSYARR